MRIYTFIHPLQGLSASIEVVTDTAGEWFNFRNMKLQTFSAIVSAIKELFANIGKEEITKRIKSEYNIICVVIVRLHVWQPIISENR